MKPRDSAVKAKRFEVAEKARKIASLEGTIRDFELMAVDLARQIANEEDRTGIRDEAHFAYSTFAKAAAQRRVLVIAPGDRELGLEVGDGGEQIGAALALKRLEPAVEERDRGQQSKGVSRIVASG